MKFTRAQIESFAKEISKQLNNIVFNKVCSFLKSNPEQRKFINPAFPFPQQLRIGILKGLLAIEYIGPEKEEEKNFPVHIAYHPDCDLFTFLEIDIDHIKVNKIEMSDNIENMNFFLGNSVTYLCDYFYDFIQSREDYMLNGFMDLSKTDNPCVMNNVTFFYTDKNDGLKIRHIDLLEIFPILEEGIPYHTKESLEYFARYIISNKFPAFDIKLHKYLNDFIELINLPDTNEVQITKFITTCPEILQIAFGFHHLNPQKEMIWQDRNDRPNLKPDFLPQSMDGYCNILDFKLPYLKTSSIVGRPERQHPSYEIDECIAQLDSYEEYCKQYVNKQWLEQTYNIKVESPQRYIIMGHSKDFLPEHRQKIRQIRNTTFFTYDEFIEMARFQIYRIK